MNVRGAIEKRDQTVEQVQAQPTVAQVVRGMIEAQSSAFRTVLPKHVDPDRFARLTLAAVKASPQLMQCFDTEMGQTSVLLAAMQAAAVGLEPNTPTQDAWILPRRKKITGVNGQPDTWVWEAQLMIGYRGLLKLARRSGDIKTVFAAVVREGDHFVYARGLEEDTLEHRPGPGTGELTHAYAVARYKSGGYSFEVLSAAQVEARREMSDSWQKGRAYSPWQKWPEAMWRKSALRALIPYLELSPEDERAVTLDERSLAVDTDAGVVTAGQWEDPAEDVPELPAGNNEVGVVDDPATETELRDRLKAAKVTVKTAIGSVQKQFPDRAGELATLDGIAADPQAVDWLMGAIED